MHKFFGTSRCENLNGVPPIHLSDPVAPTRFFCPSGYHISLFRDSYCSDVGIPTPNPRYEIPRVNPTLRYFSHRTVFTDPDISQRNLIRSSGLSHMLMSRQYGQDLSWRKSEFLSSELPNPRFSKRVVSQHMSISNQMVHDCFGVSIMECPYPLLLGLSISRFLIFWNGKYHNTCPPSFRRSRSILELSPLVSEV